MSNHLKSIIKSIIISLLATAGFYTNSAALEVPALRARVNDYANLLSAQTISSLEAKLEQFEKSDSTQLVVLTIPSLEGEVLEQFSIRVAEKWKIGQKKLDNGAILLISKADRAVRIEVGYGLEGKLTDLMSGRIINDIIIPNFRDGNFDAGVEQGIDAIIGLVKGEFTAKDMPQVKKRNISFSSKYIFLLVFLFFIVASVGKSNKIFSGIFSAVILPVLGLIVFPIGIWLLILVPVGFLLGLIIPFFMRGTGHRHGGGFFGSGGFGGFGSGGGGFSGGGGGFGGGGASGRW